MKKRATFINGLNCQEPIMLTHVISCDNVKQTGEQLQAFIQLVNQHKKRINEVIFVETAYLARHYQQNCTEEQLSFEENQWQITNQGALNLLDVPYKVKHWSTWVKDEKFPSHYKVVQQEYESKHQFKAIVNEISNKFNHKGSRDKVINYILEECAALFFITDYLTYPGKLNAALQYVVDHLKPPFNFIAYKIKSIAEKQLMPLGSSAIPINEYSPSFFGKSLAYHADNLSLSPEEQLIFTKKFAKFCLLFKQKNNLIIQGIEHNEPNVIQFSQRSIN